MIWVQWKRFVNTSIKSFYKFSQCPVVDLSSSQVISNLVTNIYAAPTQRTTIFDMQEVCLCSFAFVLFCFSFPFLGFQGHHVVGNLEVFKKHSSLLFLCTQNSYMFLKNATKTSNKNASVVLLLTSEHDFVLGCEKALCTQKLLRWHSGKRELNQNLNYDTKTTKDKK